MKTSDARLQKHTKSLNLHSNDLHPLPYDPPMRACVIDQKARASVVRAGELIFEGGIAIHETI